MQLEARDIEMNILPPGMERHKTNQSTWDAKCVYYLSLQEVCTEFMQKSNRAANYRIQNPSRA
jgi:hypothetical protein